MQHIWSTFLWLTFYVGNEGTWDEYLAVKRITLIFCFQNQPFYLSLILSFPCTKIYFIFHFYVKGLINKKKQNFLFTGSTQNTHTRVVFWTMMQRNSAVLKERKCVFALWWIVVTFVPCAIYCLYSNCRFLVNIFGYRYG